MGLLLCTAAALLLNRPGELVDHGVQYQWIDRAADPIKDFFTYSNAKWLATTPIPADKSEVSNDSEIIDRTQAILLKIAKNAAAAHAKRGSSEQLVGDLYRVGMDESLANRIGIKPLQSELSRIGAIRKPRDLMAEIGRLQRIGVGAPVFCFVDADQKNSNRQMVQIWQSGLSLGDRDLYLQNDDRAKKLRAALLDCSTQMFTLLGDSAKASREEAADVLELEKGMAAVYLPPEEERQDLENFHRVSPAELGKMTSLDWSPFFRAVGTPPIHDLNAAQPKFLKGIAKLVQTTPMSKWRSYLRWHFTNDLAPYLGTSYVNLNFKLSAALSGQKTIKPRWRRVLAMIDRSVGEALGRIYARDQFPPEAKAKAIEIFDNVKQALRERVQEAGWLAPETKKEAYHKLDTLVAKIGYPDKWRDYSKLTIKRDSYVANAMRATEFEFQRNLNKLGKPTDRTEWGISVPTDNAYYSASDNQIVCPAGIIQPTYFDYKADEAANYGGFAAAIGHELTHGFDDQGRHFDAKGNARDWWTPEDSKRYDANAALLASQFDAYKTEDGIHLNGKQTLGENIADLGGLVIAYRAWKKVDALHPEPVVNGFTAEQRFFLSYAQSWRSKERPQLADQMAKTDVHSPPNFRVLGIVVDVPEFYTAFGAQPPSNIVRIW